MGRKQTEKGKTIIELYEKGLSNQEIANQTRYSFKHIIGILYCHHNKAKIKANRIKRIKAKAFQDKEKRTFEIRINPRMASEIYFDYLNGMKYKNLVKKYDKPLKNIYSIIYYRTKIKNQTI